MRGDLLGRMKKHQALNQPGMLQFGPPLPLAAGVFGICAVAALLCRLPYRSPRGPLQRGELSRSRAARRAAIPFWGSGLVKASFQRPGPQNEISIAFAMLTP